MMIPFFDKLSYTIQQRKRLEVHMIWKKRLNRTDYLFAITFIFMLVVALGAFFLRDENGTRSRHDPI